MSKFILTPKGGKLATLQFKIPGRPHPKARPRSQAKGGRSYNPKSNILAEDAIKQCFRDKYEGTPYYDLLPTHCPAQVSCYFHYTRPSTTWWEGKDMTTTPDLDNLIKTVTDALIGVVWIDDSQIISVTAEKGYTRQSQYQTIVIIDLFEETYKTINSKSKEREENGK